MAKNFTCRNCGHCCLNLVDAYNGCVSDADLQRWQQSGRADLATWVRTLNLAPGNQLHTAWVNPETGDDVERCPWLLDKLDRSGYLCAIDTIKPDHCRAYPEHARHAAATGCLGFETETLKTVEERI